MKCQVAYFEIDQKVWLKTRHVLIQSDLLFLTYRMLLKMTDPAGLNNIHIYENVRILFENLFFYEGLGKLHERDCPQKNQFFFCRTTCIILIF